MVAHGEHGTGQLTEDGSAPGFPGSRICGADPGATCCIAAFCLPRKSKNPSAGRAPDMLCGASGAPVLPTYLSLLCASKQRRKASSMNAWAHGADTASLPRQPGIRVCISLEVAWISIALLAGRDQRCHGLTFLFWRCAALCSCDISAHRRDAADQPNARSAVDGQRGRWRQCRQRSIIPAAQWPQFQSRLCNPG